MKNVLIIGSGLTGAVLAYKHKQIGDKVLVLEKRNHIGGNIYTEDISGICVHKYGAHIFHTPYKYIWDFVNQFVHFNNYIHEVKSRYNNKLYSLPINMNTFKEFFNIENPNEITQEHIDYIKKALYYGYSTKQWGTNKIDPKVLNRLPIRKTFNNNYFDDTFQGIPIEGYTSLIESLLQGVNRKINIKVTSNFDFTPFNIIYNTGPIDEFMNYELGNLGYRSLKFDIKFFENHTFQDYPVINEASLAIPYTRIIEHKHFNYTRQKDTIVTFEYPKVFGEPYYPINTEENNTLYKEYIKLAKDRFPNMIFCGRLGAYKYYDMDDTIKEAFEIFKNSNHVTK